MYRDDGVVVEVVPRRSLDREQRGGRGRGKFVPRAEATSEGSFSTEICFLDRGTTVKRNYTKSRLMWGIAQKKNKKKIYIFKR